MTATPRTAGPVNLKDTYRKTMDRIAEAAVRKNRRPSDVLCVAVTKNATPDQIRQLVELGHTDLGENRVQQLQQRVAQLDEYLSRKRALAHVASRSDNNTPTAPVTVRWHMIGHLQRNKAKPVVPLVKLIHSVDSLRLAEELHALGEKREQPIDVLLQVNITGEETKSGIAGPAAIHVAEQIESMLNLRLRGLMTMAPYSDNPEDARSCFARCAELFNEIRSSSVVPTDQFNILSMGMTGDFEVAIEEGANVVRIGRGIFGESDEPPEA
ncbi:MAG: YggS family pyridoxal phosphate-dependent enzyme [Phycisphaera sp.]|nr:YggS family pyridoxal phosphate-dependent enzyme [Phycisphaera sp.]